MLYNRQVHYVTFSLERYTDETSQPEVPEKVELSPEHLTIKSY